MQAKTYMNYFNYEYDILIISLVKLGEKIEMLNNRCTRLPAEAIGCITNIFFSSG